MNLVGAAAWAKNSQNYINIYSTRVGENVGMGKCIINSFSLVNTGHMYMKEICRIGQNFLHTRLPRETEKLRCTLAGAKIQVDCKNTR